MGEALQIEARATGRPAGVEPRGLIAAGNSGEVVQRDRRGLTPLQARFVTEYVGNGGKHTTAARRAGYSEPRSAGRALIRTPHVLAAIQAEQAARLNGELATLALGALNSILRDPLGDPRVKVGAAKVVLDRAGFHPAQRAKQPAEGDAKPLEEMSIAELDALIAKLSGELRAIEATPAGAPAKPETPDQSETSTA